MKRTLVVVTMLAFGSVLAGHGAEAKAIWSAQCAKCHGADGKGLTTMGKKLHLQDLTDAKVQAGLKDDEMFKTIREGRKSKEGNTLMKPAEAVTDDEVKALVQYVRGFK